MIVVDIIKSMDRYREDSFSFEKFKALMGGKVPRELAMGLKGDAFIVINLLDDRVMTQKTGLPAENVKDVVKLSNLLSPDTVYFKNRVDRKFGLLCESSGHKLNISNRFSTKIIEVDSDG